MGAYIMGKCVLLRNYDSDGNLISLECRECHEVKAVSEFSKDKIKKDGVRTICKDCAKEHRNQYYKKNADKEKEYQKQYRKENKDKTAEYKAEYYKKNADKLKEYNTEWRKQNTDKIKEYKREYDKQKVEQSLAEIKAYVGQNPQRYNYNPNEQIYGVIYLVHNVKSDRYYVGQTTIGFDNRYQCGWLHEHSRKDAVKTDLELYGEDSFEYTKIFKVCHTQQDLDKLEAYYIDYYNAYDNGYNETRGNIFTERK